MLIEDEEGNIVWADDPITYIHYTYSINQLADYFIEYEKKVAPRLQMSKQTTIFDL